MTPMTPAAIRRRLSRLEQEMETRSRARVSIWDVFCGSAAWDQLDESGKEALRLLEGEHEPRECPIEEAIRQAGLPPASTNAASVPETLDANAQGKRGLETSGPV
jgi:hypothetical protein